MARERWSVLGLIGLNLAVALVGLGVADDVLRAFMCVPSRVVGAWEELNRGGFSTNDLPAVATLLTYSFLHADSEHLFFNLLYFWVFAYLVGELIGQWWVLAIYILTAISGAICFVIFESNSITPMLGASGALLGFQGVYLALAIRCPWIPDPFVWPIAHPIPPSALATFAVIGVALDVSGVINPGGSMTAYATHLGGFIAGVFLGSFVTPVPKRTL